MKFWITLGILVLVLMSLPYLRFLSVRIRAEIKIRRACARNGFTLIPAHPLPFFFPNNTGKVDFFVRKNDGSRTYCVKLFGTLWKRNTLYLIDGDKYQWKNEYMHLQKYVTRIPLMMFEPETGIRKLRPVDYTEGLTEENSGRIISVMMVCPVPLYVKRAETKMVVNDTVMRPSYLFEKHKAVEFKAAGKEIYEGDWIFNEYLFTSSSFCNELFSSCIHY